MRRIDKAEIELRELLVRGGEHSKPGHDAYLDPGARRVRLRALRRWLAQDKGRLRALLGAKAVTP